MSPYEFILGPRFGDLHRNLQKLHGRTPEQRALGRLDVVRGDTWPSRMLAAVLRLPRAGNQIPVRLAVHRDRKRERWKREFGDCVVQSYQQAAGSHLRETFRCMSFGFDLQVINGGLKITSREFRLLGIRIPDWLAPSIVAQEAANGDGWLVDVQISWRAAGCILCYSGTMVAE